MGGARAAEDAVMSDHTLDATGVQRIDGVMIKTHPIRFKFRRLRGELRRGWSAGAQVPSRLSAWGGRHSIKIACGLWAVCVAFILALIFGLQAAPWWPYVELSGEPVTFIRADNRAEDLRNLLWAVSFIGGALAAVIALINALRRTRMMQREQDAEIFAKAVEQLGAEERAVRLGAIYALEGLMRIDFNEPGRDGYMGRQIGETLAAYVRERSVKDVQPSLGPNTGEEPTTESASLASRLAVDVEAAVTVLCRSWPHSKRPQLQGRGGVDLTQARLAHLQLPDGADMRLFDLTEADLSGAQLAKVLLDEADLHLANLTRANLNGSSLMNAELSSARMDGANIVNGLFLGSKARSASFCLADLQGARFENVDLIEADLSGANLSEAVIGSDSSGALTDLGAEALSRARWRALAPVIVPGDWELTHRGDGNPLSDDSPFDDSWVEGVGPKPTLA